MFSGVFRLTSRLRFAVTILIGLMFAVSPVGAIAHCLDMPHAMQSSAPDKGPSGQDMHDNDMAASMAANMAAMSHGLSDRAHDHSKKKHGSSASVCVGPGLALVAQCKFDITARLATTTFAAVAQSVIGLSVPPPSEPPRI